MDFEKVLKGVSLLGRCELCWRERTLELVFIQEAV